jgi:hypothetical protein
MSQYPHRVVRHQHSSAQLQTQPNGFRTVSRTPRLIRADDREGLNAGGTARAPRVSAQSFLLYVVPFHEGVDERLKLAACEEVVGVTEFLGYGHAQRLGTEWAPKRRLFTVRMRGLEPPRAFAHTDLNRARLPVPPHPRGGVIVPPA